jgi:hypothetical protein
MGSGWAFSAPAYTPGMLIRTERLNRFPAGVQGAINSAESGGRVFLAVEAGIKIRDLYLAIAARPAPLPALEVSVDPPRQPVGREVALSISVADQSGRPIPDAVVSIENFDAGGEPSPLLALTDATGVTSISVVFHRKRRVDPETHDEDIEWPSGMVTADNFEPTPLPLQLPGGPVVRPPSGPRDDLPPWPIHRGRDLTLPTLGGAGAQSIAGAISTGTHGGDVARPPIGDFVHALVVVGSGGKIRLLQRDGNPPIVDYERLRANLSGIVPADSLVDSTGTQAFDAAVVSVGRFGVTYAYVVEVHDESNTFVYEHRSISSWEAVKRDLATNIATARERDDFYMVVVSPVRPPNGDRRCYVSVHKTLPREATANAGQAFGMALPPVEARIAGTFMDGRGAVVYRGVDNRIHEIASTAPTVAWGHADLSGLAAGAPEAAGEPFAYTTEFGGQGHCARVVYRGVDNRIHEIASTAPTVAWGHADLSGDGPADDLSSRPVAEERLRGPGVRSPVEWRVLVGLAAVFGAAAGQGVLPRLSLLCADRVTDGLKELQHWIRASGEGADRLNIPGGAMFAAAADSIDRIGPRHKLGDVVNDALKAGPPEIVDQILDAVFEANQRPWLVHGRRWEISDRHDYENDCYRGDSVEIFFAADQELPARVEQVFGVFDSLRARGMPLAAWISLRFLSASTSLLGTAAFAPISCAIEVSILRGGRGNDEALSRIQDIAIRNGGRIHWGQQNDLDPNGVAAMYGDRFLRWRDRLEAIEGTSLTFSNPFTMSHGLEPASALPKVMTVAVDPPGAIRLEREILVKIVAENAATHEPVDGTVTITNFDPALNLYVSEHPTNAQFLFTFRAGPVEFDPDRHESSREYPSGTVTANGYEPAAVEFEFS